MLTKLASKRLANFNISILAIYLVYAMLFEKKRLLQNYILMGLGLLLYLNLIACFWLLIKKANKQKTGIMLLHLGIILILTGYGINLLYQKQGILQMGLGQTKTLNDVNLANYSAGVLAPTWQDKYEIKLQDLRVDTSDINLKVQSGSLVVKNKNTGVIKQVPFDFVNSVDVFELNLWPLQRGYAPLLDLPEEIIHWNLDVKKRDDKEIFEGFLSIYGVNIFARLENGRLNLEYIENNKSQTKTIKLGESFMIDDKQIKWIDSSYWVAFNIQYQPGNKVIWPGAILVVLGTFIHYLPLIWKKE